MPTITIKNKQHIEKPIKSTVKEIFDTEIEKYHYITVLNITSWSIEAFGEKINARSVGNKFKVSEEVYNELLKKNYINSEKIESTTDNLGNKNGVVKLGIINMFENSEPNLIKKIEDFIIQHSKQEEISKIIKTTYPDYTSSKKSDITEILKILNLDRKPSKYQEDIFVYISMLANDDPRAVQKHVVVEAVAGSGKTFTIEQATKLIPPHKTACFLAFNKHIVNEFKPRAPLRIKENVMTLNSAGMKFVISALKNRGHGKKLDNDNGVDKDNNILILNLLFKNKYKTFTIDEMDYFEQPVTKLVDMYKATGLEINIENTNDLMDKYNIYYENVKLEDIIMLVKDVIQINKDILNNTWDRIDFNDQIWLPSELNIDPESTTPPLLFDFVFVDETQDLNLAKIKLAIKMCKPNGSIVAVGDSFQAIYGFTGADTDAIKNIITILDAKVFPLSICYRCPKSHIRLAQKFVPHIEYATMENSGYEAIEGTIKDETMDFLIKNAKNGDKIICRNSAPLVHPCYELIRNGKKAIILGRNIGTELETIMKRVGGKDLTDFNNRLDRWKEKQVEKLKKIDENGKVTYRTSPDKIIDQYETLKLLSEDCETIKCILLKIDKIFSSGEELTEEEKTGIVLSTIHKAKGLEVKTKENKIFIIMSFNGNLLSPSFYAKKPWELQQEDNIQYVGFTRGKNEMYLIDNIKSIGV